VWGVAATGVLVETLLDRGAESDVAEALAAIELPATSADDGLVIRDIWLLRLRLAASPPIARSTTLSRAPLRPAPVRRHLTP
jgi:hypothetical protein